MISSIIIIIILEVGLHFSDVLLFLNMNVFPGFWRLAGLSRFGRNFRLPQIFSNFLVDVIMGPGPSIIISIIIIMIITIIILIIILRKWVL